MFRLAWKKLAYLTLMQIHGVGKAESNVSMKRKWIYSRSSFPCAVHWANARRQADALLLTAGWVAW